MMTVETDTIEQFREAMTAAGLTPPDHIEADGAIHRCSSNGKSSDMAGWYCLHLGGVPAGSYGDWRQGYSQTWCGKEASAMTAAEQQAHRQRIKDMQAQRDAERQRQQQEAQQAAARRWDKASPCTDHPYLTRKGVQAYGLRQDSEKSPQEKNMLLVPLRDTTGTLHSLQSITADGGKRFHTGGRVAGCYHAIGKPAGVIVVCEGYATGASIHEATGHAVAVAFNAGNLQAVAQALHERHPGLQIIVAADDDHATPGNPGMAKAQQAALSVGGAVAVPLFHAGRPAGATDFNDLHQFQGLAAVRVVFGEMEVPYD
ncbi:toprim domain-containing protein [Brachymonas denitrificans]|uniref:toprim domain-containing protein n=1 Tax=Brachymonas denitrificans TaxID=28220 RepID=UPI002AFE6F78|nr:toprim domain-containing protein [Brachymonas denitrificans]